MPSTAVLSHDIYPHIRVVLGMVIGLGVTRLLSGLARLVQHPGQHRMDAVHLGWVGSTLLALVHFWWWQFGLYQIEAWTFGTYLFVIGYAIALFLLAALLFPDSMAGYEGYGDYFQERRAWFFGVLASTYLLDVIDTLLKGDAHFARFAEAVRQGDPSLASTAHMRRVLAVMLAAYASAEDHGQLVCL